MRTQELFTAPLGDGSYFVAHNRLPPNVGITDGVTDDEMRGFFFDRFRESYMAKRPELQRLKMNELYYSGFHYKTPEMNRANKVTNLCFATVETVWPVMVEQRPRPEIIARRQYQKDDIATLQEYSEWVMDTTEFGLDHAMNSREKLKHGWCVHLLVVEPSTGICFPKPYSVFDFYPSPAARHEDDMEFCFLASPVPTNWLRNRYPELADEIVSDNIASPAYDVLVRPYFDANTMGGQYDSLDNIVAGGVHFESQPDPGGGALVTLDSGNVQGAGTTFLIQGFFRDRRRARVHYQGSIARPDPSDPTGASWLHTPSAQNWVRTEPCAESGWVCIQYTASGVALPPHEVDPCFLGLPIEIGRDYAQVGRFYCPGELDHAIPINRSINKRYNLLNRSLEYEAVPVLLADTDTGIDIDQRSVEPGDVLKKMRGSQIQWLTFGGVASQQFALLTAEKMDMDTVTGVHDVSEGRRPEGIEAASAIRNLQEAAERRIRGKEGPAFIEYTRLLKKMLVATGRKATQPIFFRGTNGQIKSIDPAVLCYEYDIRFAQGSGTALGRAANEEKYQGLFQLGLIDQQTALEKLGVPGIQTILQRTAAQQAIQAQAAAAARPPVPAAA